MSGLQAPSERPTLVQVVGSAHLGPKLQHPEAGARLAKLNRLSGSELALELLTETRDESGHRLSPLGALTASVLELGFDSAEVDLVLVATEQSPPHPGDTRAIGELVLRAVEALPTVAAQLGERSPAFRARLLLLRDFDLSATVGAVADVVRDVGPVTVAIGPGPVALQMGVIIGCLNAGISPEVIELNRQDEGGRQPVVRFQTEVSLRRWLARSGRFRALAAASAENKRLENLAEVLAAGADCDWDRAGRLAGEFEKTRRALPPVPRRGAVDHEVLRPWTMLAVRSRIAAHDPLVYVWFIRLAQLELDHLFAQNPDLLGWQPDSVTPGGACSLNGCEADHRQPGRVETVMRCSGYVGPAAPGSLRSFRERIQKSWGASRRVRHKATAPSLAPIEEYLSGLPDTRAPDQLLQSYGLPRVGVGGDQEAGRVVLSAVGYRFWDGDSSPLLSALLEVSEATEIDVVLVASDETAAAVPSTFEGELVALDNTVIRSLTGCLEAVRQKLVSLVGPLRHINVGIGPGTHAMNTALLLAGVELSYEHGAGLSFHLMMPDGPNPAGLAAATSVASVASPDVRELAPRAQLGEMMRDALACVDLQLFRQLLARAPASWREVLEPVSSKLWEAATDPTTPTSDRLGLAVAAARANPMRALCWGHAILEAGGDRQFLSAGRPSLQELRNELVHGPTVPRLSSDQVRDVLSQASGPALSATLARLGDDLAHLVTLNPA